MPPESPRPAARLIIGRPVAAVADDRSRHLRDPALLHLRRDDTEGSRTPSRSQIPYRFAMVPDPSSSPRPASSSGAGFAPETRCACGAVHRVPVGRVVIDSSAIEQLADYGSERRWSRPFVVMDANTEEAIGSRASFRSYPARRCESRHSAFLSAAACSPTSRACRRLGSALSGLHNDSIVAVGSGSDHRHHAICRAASCETRIRERSDGRVDGRLRLERRRDGVWRHESDLLPPPLQLRSSPTRTHRRGPAGYDAGRDRRPARQGVGAGRLAPVPRALRARTTARRSSGGSRSRRSMPPPMSRRSSDSSQQARPAAPAGLVESGIAMAMVGSSRPASGCEHHASHFWDLLCLEGPPAPCAPWPAGGLRDALRDAPPDVRPRRRRADALGAAGHRDRDGARPAPSFAGHDARAARRHRGKAQVRRRHTRAPWPASPAEWAAVRGALEEAMAAFPLVATALLAARIPAEQGFLDLDAATLRRRSASPTASDRATRSSTSSRAKPAR